MSDSTKSLSSPTRVSEGTAMTSIEAVTLEVPDPAAAEAFYATSFGLGDKLRLRAAEAPTEGFRGFTLSLIVSQPATADALIAAALEAGATALKPARKSLWGYGGVVCAPDGTIWKVATSSKKNSGPANRQIDQVVLLLGATDVAATKRFYVEHGLTVGKSFGRKYVEFDAPPAASSWDCTVAAPWPRMPVFRRKVRGPTALPSTAQQAPSPTRTASSGSTP